MKTITEAISKQSSNRRLADFLFILWAGGAALLSYSLVYTLRKPFTAATFEHSALIIKYWLLSFR